MHELAAPGHALDLEGYQVRAVADGAAVFDAIAEDPADVLVLDLMMPHVGGLTVCQRLRARKDRTSPSGC